MAERRSFTGATRRRKTSWSVAAGDHVARALISVGGIGTIVAVLLVLAYLVSVVLPLFVPAKASPAEQLSQAVPAGKAPLAIGADEFGLIGWALMPDGAIRAFRIDNGRTLQDLPPATTKLAGMTAGSIGADGEQGTFGFKDGSIRTGTIGFATKYLSKSELPGAVGNVEEGGVAEWNGGMVSRTPTGQFRLQRLEVSVSDPMLTKGKTAMKVVTRSASAFGFIDADGKAFVAEAPSDTGLTLSGDANSNLAPVVLEPPGGATGPPKFLALGGLGDFAYAAWEDGRLARYEIRNLKKPKLVEELRITSEGAKLQSLIMLLGGSTVVAGDSLGQVKAWFPVIPTSESESAGADGRRMVCGHTFTAEGSAATALASSSRAREVVAGYGNGRVRLLFVTTDNQVLDLAAPDARPIQAVRLAPKADRILACTDGGVSTWAINQGHPDATLSALFLPVWYEDEPQPRQAWQTTGAEPKLGLMPLVFGTLKATFYAMLFGAPLALLAALYTSEFLHPNMRARIKPTIELMASLPSVVLGFLAGLVIAPVFSTIVPVALAALVTVPFALLLGAYLWQLLPHGLGVRLRNYRFLAMLWIAIPAGVVSAAFVGPALERLLFGGDFKAWLLSPRSGSAVPGWMFILLPMGAIAVAIFMSRAVNPWLRMRCAIWSRPQCALIDFAKFLMGAALAVVVVAAVAWILDGFRLDPRGTIVGKYEELNSLVVGFAMGFAIIPLIYTIADDALTAVPAHLRSASLGAGATPWQTAVRIVIPTAMSGLFSAVMIGLGRAVGETMIVLMAAGGTPIFDVNPFNGFRTLSASIATELPDAAAGSSHQRVLFLSALTLFIITFAVNTVAEMVRQRFRRRAYEL